MADDRLELEIVIANQDEVDRDIKKLTSGRQTGGTASGPASGGRSAIAAGVIGGASAAVFSRLLDGIKSLETSVGSAFDASTSLAEKQAGILEGLAASSPIGGPALAAAVKAAVGPLVEEQQQTISRLQSTFQEAAEAIALSAPAGSTRNQIRERIQSKLGGQIDKLQDIERRRSQGSVLLQELLASRSRGLDVGEVSEQATRALGNVAEQGGATLGLPGFEQASNTQSEAADKQLAAAEMNSRNMAELGRLIAGRASLGDTGGT